MDACMSETSPPTRRQQIRAMWQRSRPFLGGVAATFLAIWLYGLILPPPPPLSQADVDATIATAMAAATQPPAPSRLVYQIIQPSLVLIQVSMPPTQSQSAIGAGVIVSDQGDILTSLHVVAGATFIQVTFADGTISPAQIVAEQPENDIAVLQAMQPPAQIIPAVLGNPDAMQVGDEAYVVGHPIGLYNSMSAGVISGFDRSFIPPNGGQQLNGLIQIDAAVNPGNSGGPLLNRAGQVIGIVTGLANPAEQESFAGIGFAVPITTAGTAAGLPPY
jgi:S1-C subfamily serine protease